MRRAIPSGLRYLVYANGPDVQHLAVSLCSPRGWIGDNNIAADLRYLRNERPVPSDLEALRPWRIDESSSERDERRRAFEENRRRYEAATGKICGLISGEGLKGVSTGTVSFLSDLGYSPVEHPKINTNADGSFCSPDLGAAKYYLYFTGFSDWKLRSASYYPGATSHAKAKAIVVSAGHKVTDIDFRIPSTNMYSVRGFVSANDKLDGNMERVTLMLIGLDGAPRQTWQSTSVDFSGWFPLPKVKYFSFDDVVPGRYLVYAEVSGRDWFIRKAEVEVTTHSKFISVGLIHNKSAAGKQK